MSLVTSPTRSGPNRRLIGVAAIIIILFFGLLGAYWFAHNGVAANARELPYDQFNRKLDDGRIYKDDKHPLDLLIEEGSQTQTLAGFYSDLLPAKDHLDRLQPFHTTVFLDYDKDLKERLTTKDLVPNIRNKSNVLATTLLSFLPILLFLLMFTAAVGVVIWVLARLVSAFSRRPNPPALR